jgi:putative colanic acid biosysnthesis UDP-glucose lipid carrier transferase
MQSLVKVFFLIGDLLFLNLCIYFSLNITESPIDSSAIYLLIFSNLTWFFLVLVSNPYSINKGWSVSKIFRSQVVFIFIHILVIVALIYFLKQHYSVFEIALIYVLFVPLFFSWKIVSYYLRKLFTAEVPFKNYIIIGKNVTGTEIRKYYMQNPELRYRFVTYFDNDLSESGLEQIRNFCVKSEIHEIICCVQNVNNASFKQLVSFGLDTLVKVRMVVDFKGPDQQSIPLDRFDNQKILDIVPIPLDQPQNQFIKRIFDVVFSTAFLLLTMSWLLPILAIIIKLDSRGPVFFVQLRSGQDNKPFKCLKFRSMKVNVEADAKQATKDDPRITKLGMFLRKSSIDEFPQFFNVFIGSMSVIGPRPHMLKHTEEYSKLIDTFMGRHYVKPGITGLAQCMGYRGETQTVADMENRVRLDRYYIENWTFWLDIKIVFLTVVSLIRGSDKAF